jgi:hypothetical protein
MPISDSLEVFKRLGHVSLIVALLVATGGHWAVLQSVAWTTMLANNLRDGSFSEAVERTFDGKHPCALCRQIAEGKKSEKKAEFPVQSVKLEFVCEHFTFVFSPPQQFCLLPGFNSLIGSQSRSPAVPPPRRFLG